MRLFLFSNPIKPTIRMPIVFVAQMFLEWVSQVVFQVLTQIGQFSNPLFGLNCAPTVIAQCPGTKSLLNFFPIRSSSGFLGISCPKMDQKRAFFEIFKSFIWTQMCAYSNCPCTNSLLIFFGSAA